MEYTCVICLQVYDDPCFASDGYIYCRICLSRWAATIPWISPRTNLSIPLAAIVRSAASALAGSLALRRETLQEDIKSDKALASVACSFDRGTFLATPMEASAVLARVRVETCDLRSYLYAFELTARDPGICPDFKMVLVVENLGGLLHRDAYALESPLLRMGSLMSLFHAMIERLAHKTPCSLALGRMLLTHLDLRFGMVDEIIVPHRNGKNLPAGSYLRSDSQVPGSYVRFASPDGIPCCIEILVQGTGRRGSLETPMPPARFRYHDGTCINLNLGTQDPPSEVWKVRRQGLQVFPDNDDGFSHYSPMPCWPEEAQLFVYERAIIGMPEGFSYIPQSSHPHLIRAQLNVHQIVAKAMLG
jgi:hypothetical protein